VALCVAPSFSQWQSLNGGVNHPVRSFAQPADSSRVLVGGTFPFVYQDSLRANNIAWWDGENWSIEGLVNGNGDTSFSGNSSPVYSLAISGDTIFAGHLSGYWHGDQIMRNAAMLADGVWQPCGSPENQFWFLQENGRLFNGGRSDTLYGQYMPMVNEWLNGTWQPVSGSPFDNTGSIYDATYWKGDYYFVGSFLAEGARSAIRFNGVNEWTPLADGIGGAFTETVCGYGDSLYVGGFLLPGSNVQSKHVQLWDGETWLPFFPQVEYVGVVRDIQVHDGALYISGIYTWAGDTTWYGLLRYDGHQLCSIGGPMPSGDNTKMAFFQEDLYLGIGATFPSLEWEFIGRLPMGGLVPDTCITVTPTAINDPSSQRTILQVFPNPATDEISVALTNAMGNGSWWINDGLGRCVLQGRTTRAGTLTIMTEGLAQGTYTLKLMSNMASAQARFIRQ